MYALYIDDGDPITDEFVKPLIERLDMDARDFGFTSATIVRLP